MAAGDHPLDLQDPRRPLASPAQKGSDPRPTGWQAECALGMCCCKGLGAPSALSCSGLCNSGILGSPGQFFAVDTVFGAAKLCLSQLLLPSPLQAHLGVWRAAVWESHNSFYFNVAQMSEDIHGYVRFVQLHPEEWMLLSCGVGKDS